MKIPRLLLAVLLGIALGTVAFFPMFVSAAGHDSRSVFVDIADSVVLNWPFLLADALLPGAERPTVSNLGAAIHYGFYVLVAWLLLSLPGRGASRPARP